MIIDYNEQMLNYYPEVIKAIKEFQVIVETESLSIEEMHNELDKLLENAYVGTADKTRISQWEKVLGITPLPQGEDSLETWLSDRRETILARLYKVEKLNTKSISDIVKIFTGGSAVSYFEDGTIYVLITPPEKNKQYKFENVEQELRQKAPAHLSFSVATNYWNWNDVKTKYTNWNDVENNHTDWNDVLYHP